MCHTLGCLQVSVPTLCSPTAVVPAPPALVIVRQTANKGEDLSLAVLTPAIPPTFGIFHDDTLLHSKIRDADNHNTAQWRVIIPIEISRKNLTLSSLRYMIKYSSTFDAGNSMVQADVVLSTEKLAPGVTMAGDDEYLSNKLYRTAAGGCIPLIVNHETCVSLLTMSSVKCNGGGAQWSHFIDGHGIHPNVRLVDVEWNLYLVFNVAEYSTKDTKRMLAVEAITSWGEKLVGKTSIEGTNLATGGSVPITPADTNPTEVTVAQPGTVATRDRQDTETGASSSTSGNSRPGRPSGLEVQLSTATTTTTKSTTTSGRISECVTKKSRIQQDTTEASLVVDGVRRSTSAAPSPGAPQTITEDEEAPSLDGSSSARQEADGVPQENPPSEVPAVNGAQDIDKGSEPFVAEPQENAAREPGLAQIDGQGSGRSGQTYSIEGQQSEVSTATVLIMKSQVINQTTSYGQQTTTTEKASRSVVDAGCELQQNTATQTEVSSDSSPRAIDQVSAPRLPQTPVPEEGSRAGASPGVGQAGHTSTAGKAKEQDNSVAVDGGPKPEVCTACNGTGLQYCSITEA